MGEISKAEFTIHQLQEELESSRQNEARYRKLAEDAHSLNQRVVQMTRALGKLSRSKTLAEQGLTQSLDEILAQSCACLQVDRASIWLFEERMARLRCRVQRGDAEMPAPLSNEQIPIYFASLQEAVVLATDDIFHDPRTQELHEYAKTYQVSALLDAPIRVRGELVGVVCHEHQHTERIWLDEEKGFAAAIGDLIALALITQREQNASLSASASEAKYQSLVESLPVAIYSFQPHSEALNYISPQIHELSGITVDEWYAGGGLRAWLSRIHPNDRRLVEERIKKGMLIGKEPDAEYRIQHADGSWRWIRDSYRSVRNANGAPIGLQGILQDITSQMQAQTEKQEAERRFFDLLTQGQLLAFTLDEEGRITFVNDAMSALLESPREALLGKDWFALTLPASERLRARELLFSPQKSREEAAFELTLLLPDGRLTVRWAVTHLFKSGSIRGVACIGMDLTARAETEAKERALQNQESLSRFAAGVAHDVTHIITAQQRILGRLLDDAQKEGASQDLRRYTQWLAQFSDGLLQFAKQAPPAPTHVEVDALIEESLGLLRMLLGQEIELSCSLRAPGLTVYIEPTQLRQVLTSLALNAKDAMPSGGVASVSTEELFIDLSLSAQLGLSSGSYLKIQFRDTGKSTSESEMLTSGFGLVISDEVVKRAAGKIMFVSKETAGASVLVYLPKSAKD
jgi:PAS domain S-box-containing protein